jgi:hypothetical protein
LVYTLPLIVKILIFSEPSDKTVGEDLSIISKLTFASPDKVCKIYLNSDTMTRKRISQSKIKDFKYYNLVNYLVYM